MDHLPRLQSPAQQIIEVPYFGQRYDGEDFLNYPQRMGWDKSLLVVGNFTEKPIEQTRAMLQTWLYFGLLFEVLQVPLLSTEFLRRTPSGQIITTAHLPEYMDKWKTQFKCFPTEKQLESLLLVDACLMDTSLVLKRATQQSSPDGRCILPETVSLSIAILGSALDFLRWSVMQEFRLENNQLNMQYSWPVVSLLKSQMEIGGWCKSEINILEEGSLISAAYFASNIHRTKSRIGNTHGRCSEERCIANEISKKIYQSCHITTCNCSRLEPSNADIVQILDRGGIPVIRLDVNMESGQPEIAIVDSTIQPYIAISHVWSDGLGNILGNWLYRCQFIYLQDLVNQLWRCSSFSLRRTQNRDSSHYLQNASEEHVFFWIDTICVPLQQAPRKLAISRMKKTYQEARAVLVLDSELQQLSIHRSKQEILMRISFSGWMRRVWTLQEGILAQRLFFQMVDGVVQFSSLHDLSVACIKSAHPHSLLLFECSSKLNEMFLFKKLQNCKRIMWAWNAFLVRSTSHKEDAHIVFGTLLGLAIEELPVKWEYRMIKLLSQLQEFPQGILFAHGVRIQKNGYRWGLNFPPGSALIDSTPAPRSQLGLQVKLPGFNLGQLRGKPDEISFLVDMEDRRRYVLNCREDGFWAKVQINEGQDYALILPQHPHKFLPKLQTVVFVSINNETQGVLYVKFICQISLAYMPSGGHERNLLKAQRYNCDKKWCVG